MKREKGSALLTVILIVAVTATIGAALASFILMNYRLRAYDTQLRRAEYKAEEVIDTTHLYLLSEFGNTSNGIFDNLKDTIDDYVRDDRDDVNFRKTAGYYYEFDGTSAIEKSNIEALKDEKYKQEFASLDIENIIEKIIGTDSTDGTDGNDDTIFIANESSIPTDGTAEGKMYVFLGNKIVSDNRITQKVNICYVIPKNAVIRGNPIAKFSVEYVIACPDYSMIQPTNYNITDYIGITNWKIENNWKL